MRRIIEELIEKRKKQQEKLKKTIEELGKLIEGSSLLKGIFKKNKNKIGSKLIEFNNNLNELITIQNKEWDAYSNNHSTMVFKSLQWKIEKLDAEYSNIKTILSNFLNLEKSIEKLIASIDDKANPQTREESIKRLDHIKEQLSPYQYSEFEQRFRGDERQVKEKLKQYLPFFAKKGPILDIGCGRGEFIELLLEQGKKAQGIDNSNSMLKLAEEKGLPCIQSDALDFLQQQSAGTWGGIFSAQVVEHLHPQYLRELIIEAYRILSNNSPILLETVNPLSLFALSNIYFLDITHQKPLHPEFMRYLLESTGFNDVKIIYSEELQIEQLEAIAPENQLAREFNTNVDKLNKLLYASPVYAVTGVKN